LILFNFLGLGATDVASERLSDTAIASVLAFLASNFLFPHWESHDLRGYMASVLKANIHYLQKLKEFLYGNKMLSMDYKLVRKELFVSTANLSSALHRMLSEPKNKQKDRKLIYEFVVLNHVLSSNIASLTATMSNKEEPSSKDVIKKVSRTISNLKNNLVLLDKSYTAQKEEPKNNALIPEKTSADPQLNDQLNFICKVSEDIGKITKDFTN